MNTAWAVVLAVEPARHGVIPLTCRPVDGSECRAAAYSQITGPVHAGDQVLLNTTAVDLRLGTGGVHFVIANVSAPGHSSNAQGHIMKMRYTPLQIPVQAVEEPDSPHHAAMAAADGLSGMPVVCCELLSQTPAVIAGCRFAAPNMRAAMVVTDGAALPVAFSELIATLRETELVETVITAGQAFGGDMEAVNLYSALLAARHVVEASIAIVTPGPGTVGSGTRWGFGGVAQGEALNAAHVLGGRPIGVVRASSGDGRERHNGISHHTRTVFTRVALGHFSAAWPDGADGYFEEWRTLQKEAGDRMQAHGVSGAALALDAFDAVWLPWQTMGRGRGEDPLFFEAAAAAGLLAGRFTQEGG